MSSGDYGKGTIERDSEALHLIGFKRGLIQESLEAISLAQNPLSELKDLPKASVRDNYTHTSEELAHFSFEQWKTSKPLNTGLNDLDRSVINFNRGEVWFMAGRTGTKKTSLAMQVLESITKNEGSKGVFFSLEMAELQFSKRLAEMKFYTKVDKTIWAINEKKSFVAIDSCNRYLEKHKSVELFLNSSAPYQICFEPSLTLDKICVWIRKYKREFGDISTIVIDYFQLLRGKGQDRRAEVSTLARELKGVAKSENIRIIALSQTSRNNGIGVTPVELSDLKESGDIEECADIVTGQNLVEGDNQIMNLRVLKGRNGSILTDITLGVNGVAFENLKQADENFYNCGK